MYSSTKVAQGPEILILKFLTLQLWHFYCNVFHTLRLIPALFHPLLLFNSIVPHMDSTSGLFTLPYMLFSPLGAKYTKNVTIKATGKDVMKQFICHCSSAVHILKERLWADIFSWKNASKLIKYKLTLRIKYYTQDFISSYCPTFTHSPSRIQVLT